MELLSPAGNLIAAYSAFKGGADAVYVGGKQFSARASAENFSNDELKEITFFAHSIGKKVYVTLNTLLFQDEFFEAVEFAKFLYQIRVDGVIIQDLGLANYLHKTLPNLPLNASTQLNCHNIRQAEALVKLGFKRIVLARETNLEFAKKVKDLGVEVEVFGHGALCVSYSGNCLLSSFIGDRSGNRGRCAQPCRMQYDLLEDGNTIQQNTFAISTKDLMTLDNLQEFVDLRIDSLKIEGRLKSNEYIYTVSKAYRHAIDAAESNKINKNSAQDKSDLIKIFNRQFTKGYVLNESPFKLLNTMTSSHQGESIGRVTKAEKGRISIQLFKQLHRLDGIRFNTKDQFGLTIEKMFLNKQPVEEAGPNQTIEIIGIEHFERYINAEVIKTKDYLLNKKIQEELSSTLKVKIEGKFFAHLDKPIKLTISYNGNTVTAEGIKPLIAEESGTSEERIIDQLNKTGDYPYSFSYIDVDLEKCFIPIREINALRNTTLQMLVDSFKNENSIDEDEYKSSVKEQEIYTKYAGKTDDIEVEDVLLSHGFEAYTHNDTSYINNNRITTKESFENDHEIVHFYINKKSDNYLIASQYCNITNSYALDAFFEAGFDECILSSELDYLSINHMINDYKNRHGFLPRVGIVMYGKIDMMIMRSCPIGTYYKNQNIKCNRCHRKMYELKDRTGEKYALVGDSECNTKILNNRPIYLLDRFEEMQEIGISSYYFLFNFESKNEAYSLIHEHIENNPNFNRFKHTRGHYQKRPL